MAKLETRWDGLVVLALYHPPVNRKPKDIGLPAGIARWLGPGPVNADRLRSALASRNNMVLCRHDHPSEDRYGPAQGVWQGMGRAVCDAEKKRASYAIYILRAGEPYPSWRTRVTTSA